MSNCNFPEHHGSGGGGGFTGLLAVLVAIVAAACLSPVIAALTVLIHVLMIAVPLALAAFVALAVWRVKRGSPVLPHLGYRHARALPGRAARPLPHRQQRPGLEQQDGGQHVHLHLAPGMAAEDVAAILRGQGRPPLP